MEKAVSIALWTHPRSVSTAFERYFLERRDFQVFHEEFSAIYQSNASRAKLPHARMSSGTPSDYVTVRDRMENARFNGPVFHKDMCYHALDALISDHDYLAGQKNVFLVRTPEEAVLSLATIHPAMDFDCIGYAEMPVLFEHARQATGMIPLVIDSADLTRRPEATLRMVCEYAGVPFDPAALVWQAAMPPQWQTWAAWHSEAALSSGFMAPRQSYSVTFDSHPKLRAMVDFCRPFYAHMKTFAPLNNQLATECI